MKKFIALVLLASGFGFAEKVLVIDVEGMTCEMCPVAVKKAISQVNGVKWVKTSLKNRIAVVVTEDGIQEEEILKAIPKAGRYKGRLIGETKF